MPGKIHPFAHYLLALAITICGYTLYAKFAVPAIEGPPVSLRRQQPVQIPINPRTEADKSYLAALVPEHSWELDSCKMLLTPQGTIFFKEWTRVDDEGTYDLFPFTLVMNDPGLAARQAESDGEEVAKQKSPTILRSVAGATLKFTKPLTLGSDQEKAEMQSARLKGSVTIFQPAADVAKDEDLRILTRNVQIDRHRIFTLDDVDFEYGRHRGSGRNLAIELAHDQTNYASRTFSTISGVNQLELASVSRLVLQPEKSSGLKSGANKQDIQTAAFSNAMSPLELSCDGPFLFQFENRTAEFQDNVIVRQLDRFGDNIHCSKLKIVFAENLDEENAIANLNSTDALNTTDTQQSGLKVKSFLALGSDALGMGDGQPAVVTSHSRQAKIIGHRIAFDVNTGRIQAGGSQQVSISSPQFSFFSKELEYELADNGSIGPLTATGPGQLIRNSDDPARGFSASWNDRLTIRPYIDTADAANSQQERRLIVLEGKAFVQMGTENSIASDKLDLVVWQLPAPEAILRDVAEETPSENKWQYLPSWLATRGQVQIFTPELEGTARELIAKWPQPVLKVPTAEQTSNIDNAVGIFSPNNRSRNNQQLTADAGQTKVWQSNERLIADRFIDRRFAARHIVRRVTQEGSMQPVVRTTQYDQRVSSTQFTAGRQNVSANDANNSKAKTNKSKLRFDGDVVVANLYGDLDALQIRDLAVDGHVSLIEMPDPNSNDPASKSPPMRIAGENLRMVPQGNDLFRVRVGGSVEKPATLWAQGLKLAGKSLHLDQLANKLWMEGAGRMKIEPEQSKPSSPTAPNSTAAKTSNSNDLDVGKIDSVEIAWAGGMIFDGARIYFEREIILDAKRPPKDGQQSSTRTLSQALTVELSEAVNFRELSAETPAATVRPKVKRMLLVNNVAAEEQAFQLASYVELSGLQKMIGKPIIVVNETRDSQGKLIELQKILAAMASVNAETGNLIAKGPGKVLNYQFQDASNNSKLTGFSAKHKNEKKRNQRQPEIACVHVNFDGELTANTQSREMLINGNVRTAYATVDQFEQPADPDKPEELPVGSVTLRCDRLQSAQWTPRGQETPTIEIVATGNAHIKSQLFESTAQRLTYEEAKDMLIIEGSARSDANLWYQQSPKSSRASMTGKKIMYRLSDQWTHMPGTKRITIPIKASRK